jgi:hypothetical protein
MRVTAYQALLAALGRVFGRPAQPLCEKEGQVLDRFGQATVGEERSEHGIGLDTVVEPPGEPAAGFDPADRFVEGIERFNGNLQVRVLSDWAALPRELTAIVGRLSEGFPMAPG